MGWRPRIVGVGKSSFWKSGRSPFEERSSFARLAFETPNERSNPKRRKFRSYVTCPACGEDSYSRRTNVCRNCDYSEFATTDFCRLCKQPEGLCVCRQCPRCQVPLDGYGKCQECGRVVNRRNPACTHWFHPGSSKCYLCGAPAGMASGGNTPVSSQPKIVTVRVEHDDQPISPRNPMYGNLGRMYCWHKRYNLGDEQPKEDPQDWYADPANVPLGSITLPLYLYDHSGITMNTSGFSDRWDSGQVGWIVATPDAIAKFGIARNQVENALRLEVKIYDWFLRGACWGFVIEEDGNETESVWGFSGDTLAETGMEESVDDALPPGKWNLHPALEKAFDHPGTKVVISPAP